MGRFRRWFEANRRDLRFLAIFLATLGIYYVLTTTSPVEDRFFPAYLRLNADASAGLLGLFGVDVAAEDQSLSTSNGISIRVARGCDAVAPSVLFVAAVLASPVPLRSRLVATMVGTILLMLLNLVRVGSLFLVRVHWPRAFETMHLDVWQWLFIILAIAMWMYWASRTTRAVAATGDGST